MKKNSLAIRLIGTVFFLAVIAYIAVYAASSLGKTEGKFIATTYSWRDTIEVSGLVARDEEALLTYHESVYVMAEDGKRIPGGGVVANVYASDESLGNAERMHELETKIARLTELSKIDSSDVQNLDAEIKSAVRDLRYASEKRELSDIDSLSVDVDTLMLTLSNELENTDSRLREAEREYDSLRASNGSVYDVITAPRPGLFSSAVDGHESISPDSLFDIKPSQLDAMLSEMPERDELAFGKIVYGITWYYAANVSTEDCKKFSVGDTVTMIFGRYYSERIKMTVESISEPENGEKVMVFSCDSSLSDVLAMRDQTAQMILSEDSGIRIPRVAARVDDNGRIFVYVQTGMRAEKKYIEILHDTGDFYVVSSDTLRAGDTVLTSGKEMYEGKVLK